MEQSPRISVIIPVFNRPQFLRRALLSLLNQTFTDWEAIIVDDGSTDNTVNLASKFIINDQRFTLIKIKHSGVIKTKNTAIKLATGTFITFLDSDDEYHPKHLELRLREFIDNPKLDLLHSGFIVIGDEMIVDKRDWRKKINLYDPTVYLGGTCFGKKEVFLDLKGFLNMQLGSGSNFVERAMKKFNVKRVIWPTYIYHREHEDSISKNIEKRVNKKYSTI